MMISKLEENEILNSLVLLSASWWCFAADHSCLERTISIKIMPLMAEPHSQSLRYGK